MPTDLAMEAGGAEALAIVIGFVILIFGVVRWVKAAKREDNGGDNSG